MVSIGLPGGRDCGAADASCTADGRELSNSPSAVVGPEEPATANTPVDPGWERHRRGDGSDLPAGRHGRGRADHGPGDVPGRRRERREPDQRGDRRGGPGAAGQRASRRCRPSTAVKIGYQALCDVFDVHAGEVTKARRVDRRDVDDLPLGAACQGGHRGRPRATWSSTRTVPLYCVQRGIITAARTSGTTRRARPTPTRGTTSSQ